jgi:hypothetical protein
MLEERESLGANPRPMASTTAAIDDRDGDGKHHYYEQDIGQIEIHLESFPVSAEIEQTAIAAVPVPVGW